MFCFFALAFAASLGATEVMLTVDVPAGKFKAVRLRNLPKGALVAIAVQASGVIVVAFLSAADADRFPTVKRPLFLARVEKRLSFSVTTPAAGNYFVVFDNRTGDEARSVAVTVEATRPKPADSGPGTKKSDPF